MENNGWIKLHRKLLNNPISAKPTYAWTWITLLLMANHEDNKFIFNGKEQILYRGQILTGRKKLSEQTGVSEATTETILNYLETSQQISQQKTNKYRLITVLNYDTYQTISQQSNSKVTTKSQQTDTNKNVKNVKNIYNTNPSVSNKELLEEIKPNDRITQDWQYLALDIIEKLKVPDNKKSSFFKVAKTNPNICNRALQFAIDFPNPKIRWNMFFVKYNELIKNGK